MHASDRSALVTDHEREVRSRLLRLTADAAAGGLGAAIETLATDSSRGGVVHPFGTGHSETSATEVSSCAGRSDLDGVDVQDLAIGSTGHVGSDEPGASLTSLTRPVRSADRTRTENARFFAGPDEARRYTPRRGVRTSARGEGAAR